MKRVQVSPGKFVIVSTALAEKAARVFASVSFTQDDVRVMVGAESSKRGLILGGTSKPKPLAKRIAVKPSETKLRKATAAAARGRTGQFASTAAGGAISARRRKAA